MDTETQLAWAAGLYDGEGSASMYIPRLRKTPRRQMQVSQGGIAGVPPEVLMRFRGIVNEGHVTGPYRDYLFYWKTTRKDVIDVIFASIWPYLSAEKRTQFATVTLAAGRVLPALPEPVRAQLTEYAWAAGLFDGEGSIYRSGRGAVYLELPQSSATTVPDTLVRFHAAVRVGQLGGPYPPRSPWSRLPHYQWTAGARNDVDAVLVLLWPYLSAVKRAQADCVFRAVGRVLPAGV